MLTAFRNARHRDKFSKKAQGELADTLEAFNTNILPRSPLKLRKILTTRGLATGTRKYRLANARRNFCYENCVANRNALSPARYAAIDVGTNSTKMLVAELGDNPAAVFTLSAVTRLGEGMTPNTLFLREVPIRRTLDALAEMADAARQQGAAATVAVGTAALRDAENRDDFLRRAMEKTNRRYSGSYSGRRRSAIVLSRRAPRSAVAQ